MRKNESVGGSSQNRLGNALFLGLPISLLLTLLGLLLCSVLLTYSSLSEGVATLQAQFLSPVAVLIGAILSGGRACTKGWLSGFLLALFYGVVLYAFRSFGYGVFAIDGGFLWTLLGVFLAGVLGGILGINWFGRKC